MTQSSQSRCCLHILTVRTSRIPAWRCGAHRRRVVWDKSWTNRLLAWKNKKNKNKMKTKRHSDVVMVGCTLSSRLCVHASGEDGTKKVWDSEQQGVGVCPGWRHFWVGFTCRTFPEHERSTERTQCFKSDTLWASCTPLIRTGKRLFSLLTNTI